MTQTPVTEKAFAKVNLTLCVRGRRPDGYHQLESLIAFATDVLDTVSVSQGRSRRIVFEGPFAMAQLQAEPDRTTVGAVVQALADEGLPIDFDLATIDKHIPLAAGLGGGSADAAALLRAAQRLIPDKAQCFDWQTTGLSIGADVPACLLSRACMMSGMGEAVFPIDPLPRCYLVLANAQGDVPANKTAQVFQRLAAEPVAEPVGQALDLPAFSRFADLLSYLSARGNDLEATAGEVMESVTSVKAAMMAQAGCQLARMTGAGPTVFGLFESCDEAMSAKAALQGHNPKWWIAVTGLQ